MGIFKELFEPNYDDVVAGQQYFNKEDYVKKTGIDGVKALFQHDQHGSVSPQMTILREGTLISGLVGAVWGGCIHARDARIRFLRTNQATVFENPHLARRLLYDRVMLGLAKGSWIWSWRLMVFSSTFIFLGAAVPAYRGKHSVFDWTLASTTAAAVYKFKHGPKPMVAGAAMGALLGTGAGVVVAGLLWLAGLTMDDVYMTKHQMTQKKLEERHERLLKTRKEIEKTADTNKEPEGL